MQILHSILDKLDDIKPARKAYAHCDIPCGIYDPHTAQMAAHTVIRMVQLIQENKDDMHMKVRCALVKEQHAELVKHEVRILMGDYFKQEHVEKHPELHELVHKTMSLGSQARQTVDMKVAEDLLETVNKIAEIFWSTKDVETTRAKPPYPTEKESVVPKM